MLLRWATGLPLCSTPNSPPTVRPEQSRRLQRITTGECLSRQFNGLFDGRFRKGGVPFENILNCSPISQPVEHRPYLHACSSKGRPATADAGCDDDIPTDGIVFVHPIRSPLAD